MRAVDLGALTGSWSGRARLWFEADVLACDDGVEGETVAVGGGRWLRHDYTTRIEDKEHRGSALIGRGPAGAWQVAWVDTFHTAGTGIMLSEGPASDNEVMVLGSYPAGEGPPWGWRTVYEPAGDALVVRHHNISPDGEETLAVQFDLERG